MKALLPLILGLAALISGCAHERSYDSVVAVNAQVLNERTKAALADGDSGRLSLAESRRFLRQSQEQVRSVRARAGQCQMSANEIDILNWLDGEYTALLRRRQPVRTASAGELQNTLAKLHGLRPIRTPARWETTFGGSDTDLTDAGSPPVADSGHCSGGHDGGGCGHR